MSIFNRFGPLSKELPINKTLNKQKTTLLDAIVESGRAQIFGNDPEVGDSLIGIVLRVDGEKPIPPGHLLSSHYGSLTKIKNSIHLKIRVPEIHLAYPIPDCKNDPVVDLYPTFIYSSHVGEAPPVGSLVKVEFLDKKNLKHPVCVGIIKNENLIAENFEDCDESTSLEKKFQQPTKTQSGQPYIKTIQEENFLGDVEMSDILTIEEYKTITQKSIGKVGDWRNSIPQYIDILKSVAQSEGMDWALLAAHIAAESGFKWDAMSGVGAVGFCQIMPCTGRGWKMKVPAGILVATPKRKGRNLDCTKRPKSDKTRAHEFPLIFDPEQDERFDLNKAAKKMARNDLRYYKTLDNRWDMAMGAYNMGLGGIKSVIKKVGGADNVATHEDYKDWYRKYPGKILKWQKEIKEKY